MADPDEGLTTCKSVGLPFGQPYAAMLPEPVTNGFLEHKKDTNIYVTRLVTSASRCGCPPPFKSTGDSDSKLRQVTINGLLKCAEEIVNNPPKHLEYHPMLPVRADVLDRCEIPTDLKVQ
jgi:hypothetical protein